MGIRILAIDTTTEICSVAILNNKEQYTLFELCQFNHTKYIIQLIKKLLSITQISVYQLDAIAFCKGPGSFTGIRISTALAQGIAFGIDIPLISLSTLLTISQGALRISGIKKILVATDAKMNQVYFAEYKFKNGIWIGSETETILNVQKLEEKVCLLNDGWINIGTGWNIYFNLIKNNNKFFVKYNEYFLPQAIDMLPLALNAWNNNDIINNIDVDKIIPSYMHNIILNK